jgi:hypothetical protein
MIIFMDIYYNKGALKAIFHTKNMDHPKKDKSGK